MRCNVTAISPHPVVDVVPVRGWLVPPTSTETLRVGSLSRCVLEYSTGGITRVTSGSIQVCNAGYTVHTENGKVTLSSTPIQGCAIALPHATASLLGCGLGDYVDVSIIRTYDDNTCDTLGSGAVIVHPVVSVTISSVVSPLDTGAPSSVGVRALPSTFPRIASAILAGTVVRTGSLHIIQCLGPSGILTVEAVNVSGGQEMGVVTESTKVVMVGDPVASLLYGGTNDNDWHLKGCSHDVYTPQCIPRSCDEWTQQVLVSVRGIESVICAVTSLLHPLLSDAVTLGRGGRGLLFTGASGAGKTLLATTIARESGLPFVVMSLSQAYARGEATLLHSMTALAEQARAVAPCFVILDDLDTLGTVTSNGHTQLPMASSHYEAASIAAVYSFLSDVLGPTSRAHIFVIGITGSEDRIESLFTRAQYLDHKFHLQLVTSAERIAVLEHMTKHMPITDKGPVLHEVADDTFGFLGADLELLCKEAALHVLQRTGHEDTQAVNDLEITREDFRAARQVVRPSRLADFLLSRPSISFSDLAGIDHIIDDLRLYLIWPLTQPDVYKQLGARAPPGVLLHGPTGTGKTVLAQCVAHEARASFIPLRATDMITKVVGEAEAFIHRVFALARQSAPCILFIDQIEAIAPARHGGSKSGDRSLSALLTEMDGVMSKNGVSVLAATTDPTLLDPAILRAGRFSEHIQVPLPDRDARVAILKQALSRIPNSVSARDIEQLADATHGTSGADLVNMCREGAMAAVRRTIADGDDGQRGIVTPADISAAWSSLGGIGIGMNRIQICD